MSLHTVEAVSCLAASAKLPRSFLGPFISRCIAACQSSQVRAARSCIKASSRLDVSGVRPIYLEVAARRVDAL